MYERNDNCAVRRRLREGAMSSLFETAIDHVHGGRWQEFEDLITANPALVSARDYFGRTLLWICAGTPGASHAIRRLAELGAEPDARAQNDVTPLGHAIMGGSRYGLTTMPEI